MHFTCKVKKQAIQLTQLAQDPATALCHIPAKGTRNDLTLRLKIKSKWVPETPYTACWRQFIKLQTVQLIALAELPCHIALGILRAGHPANKLARVC